MFEGFKQSRIVVDGVGLNVKVAGSGPAVVLIHGYPQTHHTWQYVAPIIAEGRTVVVPDLRGYGDSDCPPSDADHRAYSKRTMANDIVGIMSLLGFVILSNDCHIFCD